MKGANTMKATTERPYWFEIDIMLASGKLSHYDTVRTRRFSTEKAVRKALEKSLGLGKGQIKPEEFGHKLLRWAIWNGVEKVEEYRAE